jgi:Protein of unknown function (DUF2934)
MAQEKAPQSRARKTTGSAEKPAAPAKKKATRAAKAVEAPAKPAVSRARRTKKTGPTHEAIALHAYYLWERGEWGTPDELWLKAESEIRAA